jgi:DNA-binding LytR/AlgR family response regulator
MDPRTRNVFVGILVFVIGLAAATAVLLGQTTTPTPPPGADVVDGVIVAVDSAGLTDVKGFDLRATDGTTKTFSLERLENGAAFPPGHLVEHQASASPVRVWYTSDGGVLYAIRLDDATPTSS